jgi:hypothetical protein
VSAWSRVHHKIYPPRLGIELTLERRGESAPEDAISSYLTAWLDFFLIGVRETADQAANAVRGIIALFEEDCLRDTDRVSTRNEVLRCAIGREFACEIASNRTSEVATRRG